MATTEDFAQYVCGQISGAGDASYKKMFGEYGFYCGGKFFGVACDNQFFIKITNAGKKLLPDCEVQPPYKGASPHFLIDDLDDKEFLTKLIRATCAELPLPKPKKKK